MAMAVTSNTNDEKKVTMKTIAKSNLTTSFAELTCGQLRQVVGGSRRATADDTIFGGSGNDVLLGDRGNDRVEQLDVNGQGGGDVIIASTGLANLT